MSSRRARRARAAAAADQRTAAAGRITAARTEIEHRALVAAAEPYRGELPAFYDTVMRVGIVPDPPAVFTEPTSVLPVVRPSSLLGLSDDETGETR